MARSSRSPEAHDRSIALYSPPRAKQRLFVKTSLGTKLLVVIDPQLTVADLQRKIADALVQRHPERGQVVCSCVSVLCGTEAYDVPSDYLLQDVLPDDDSQLVVADCTIVADPSIRKACDTATENGHEAAQETHAKRAETAAVPGPVTLGSRGAAAVKSAQAQPSARQASPDPKPPQQPAQRAEQGREPEPQPGRTETPAASKPSLNAVNGAPPQRGRKRSAAGALAEVARPAAEAPSEVKTTAAVAHGSNSAVHSSKGTNGMDAAARKDAAPKAANRAASPDAAAASSSEEEETSDEESEDEAIGGQSPAAAQAVVPDRTGAASGGQKSATQHATPAAPAAASEHADASSSGEEDSSDEDDSEGESSDDDGSDAPRSAPQANSRAGKRQNGSDLAGYQPFGSVSAPPAARAAAQKRRASAADANGRSRPAQIKQANPQPAGKAGKSNAANAKQASVRASQDQPASSEEETEVESAADGDSDGGSDEEVSAPGVSGQAAKQGGSGAATDSGSSEEDSDEDVIDDEVPDSEAGGAAGAAASVPPPCAKATAVTGKAARPSGAEANATQDKPVSGGSSEQDDEQGDDSDSESEENIETALVTKRQGAEPAQPPSETEEEASKNEEDNEDDSEDEEEPEEEPVAGSTPQHGQHAAPESSSSEDEEEQDPAPASQQQPALVSPEQNAIDDGPGQVPAAVVLHKRKRAAPETARAEEEEPAAAGGKRRKRTAKEAVAATQSKRKRPVEESHSSEDERMEPLAAPQQHGKRGHLQPSATKELPSDEDSDVGEAHVPPHSGPVEQTDGKQQSGSAEPIINGAAKKKRPRTVQQAGHDEGNAAANTGRPAEVMIGAASTPVLKKKKKQRQRGQHSAAAAHQDAAPTGSAESSGESQGGGASDAGAETVAERSRKLDPEADVAAASHGPAARDDGGAADGPTACEDGVQPLSAKQARLLKKLARQPDALAGLLQASTKKSAAKAKAARLLDSQAPQQQTQPDTQPVEATQPQGPQPPTPERDDGTQPRPPSEEGAPAGPVAERADRRPIVQEHAQKARHKNASNSSTGSGLKGNLVSVRDLKGYQVEELVRRPLSAYPDVKTLTKVVREAVREAVNEERAVRGLQPTSVTGLYKTNAKPAWWPHATFSTEQLKTRASLDAIYNALRSRFGRMLQAS